MRPNSEKTRGTLRILRPSEMTECHVSRWFELIEGKACYKSPFYHPSFAMVMDEVRADVFVTIAEVDGEVVGFFPYQTGEDRIGKPIGGRMNDFHGPIGEFGKYFSTSEFLEATQLKSWNFHALNLDASFTNPEPFQTLKSPFIDLSDGYDAYFQNAIEQSSTLRRQGQKLRRMERDLGPMRFELLSNDQSILDFVIRLKRDKYRKTGAFDIFSIDWTGKLLRRLLMADQPDFRGTLSALWAGDRLVSAHFGIARESVLHYWFPVYEPALARYSAGTQLLLEVCSAAADQGISTIDLGYGQHEFKYKFTDLYKEVGCGVLQCGYVSNLAARNSYHFKNWIKSSNLGIIARSVVRKVNPQFGQHSSS